MSAYASKGSFSPYDVRLYNALNKHYQSKAFFIIQVNTGGWHDLYQQYWPKQIAVIKIEQKFY